MDCLTVNKRESRGINWIYHELFSAKINISPQKSTLNFNAIEKAFEVNKIVFFIDSDLIAS